jgi:methionyl-tRNA formyltransferase
VLLPEEFYSAFPKGCWAVHDSLLPEYRGFAPLNWAILNDEGETGVTVFQVSEKMDGGDILLQRRIPIGADETAPQLYGRVCESTNEVVLEAYKLLSQGRGSPRAQEYRAGSFTASRTPADGLIDWAQTTSQIYNLIRALTFPYPGAFTFLQGRRLFVLSAKPKPEAPRYAGRIPGRVVQIHPGVGVDVLTGDGVLRIIEVSTDGASRLNAASLIRSVRVRLGLDIADLATRLARLEEQVGRRADQ